MKYDFEALKRRPKSEPLPADVNSMAEALAGKDRFDCPELARVLESVKQKRLFGKINVANAQGQQICTISMQSGICDRITFADIFGESYLVRPFSVVFIRSVKNEKLHHKAKNTDEGE